MRISRTATAGPGRVGSRRGGLRGGTRTNSGVGEGQVPRRRMGGHAADGKPTASPTSRFQRHRRHGERSGTQATQMVTLYHPDGASLLMTYYCSMGNQPRMRSKGAGEGKLAFAYLDATNICFSRTVADDTARR